MSETSRRAGEWAQHQLGEGPRNQEGGAAPGLASAQAQSVDLAEQLPGQEIPGSISAPSQPLLREGMGSLLLS